MLKSVQEEQMNVNSKRGKCKFCFESSSSSV
jgi:hypothetical protein